MRANYGTILIKVKRHRCFFFFVDLKCVWPEHKSQGGSARFELSVLNVNLVYGIMSRYKNSHLSHGP